MTDLEKDSYALFLNIRDAWTTRTIKRWDFMELLGAVVKLIKRFEAKESGCPTGMHFEPCTCTPAIVGRSKFYRPRKIT